MDYTTQVILRVVEGSYAEFECEKVYLNPKIGPSPIQVSIVTRSQCESCMYSGSISSDLFNQVCRSKRLDVSLHSELIITRLCFPFQKEAGEE